MFYVGSNLRLLWPWYNYQDCDLGAGTDSPKSSLIAGLNAFKEKYHVLHQELNESSRLLQVSKDEYRSLEREFQKFKEEREYLCRAASESDRKILSAAVEKENVLKELNSEVQRRKKLEEEIKSFSKAFAARQRSVVSLHSNLRLNMEKLMAKTSSVSMPKPLEDWRHLFFFFSLFLYLCIMLQVKRPFFKVG